MKKVILSLAGMLAATAFAPEASAIPAFARQMGVACQACHFQHFPELNSFGRAFKNSGFTLIGAQPKIEGEHLSIPATLNMSILMTTGFQTTSDSAAAATALTPGTTNGKFFAPNSGGELSLFVAGRVSENIGFLTELTGTIGTSGFKFPMLWEVGGGNTRVGLVVVANNSPAFSFETLNTGAVQTHRLMGNEGPATVGNPNARTHSAVTAAAQYLGTRAAGNGVSFVANGDMGFVNLGKYDLTAVAAPAASNTNAMSTTYARGAYIFNAGGWDSAVGIQSFSGSQGAPLLATAALDSKATIIDGQMQGEVGGMPLGLYASYGTAPASANGNFYNGGAANTTVLNPTANSRKSFNIAGELGVIPNKATLQLAFRSANDGTGSANVANGQGDKDNAVMLGATYELAQNVGLYLTHTAQSGSAWNTCTVVIGTCTTIGVAPVGKTVTSFTLEANF